MSLESDDDIKGKCNFTKKLSMRPIPQLICETEPSFFVKVIVVADKQCSDLYCNL